MEYKNNISNIILEIEKSEKDIFLIGDNSSGKSDVLKNLLLKNIATDNYYYIDSYNRTFDWNQVNFDTIKLPNHKEILEARMKPENFNLQDNFGSGFIEILYGTFQTPLKKMLNEFLEINFEIETISVSIAGRVIKLKINNQDYESLSNGYQATIRILIEILYATTNPNINIIIIDEINEFLSVKNEANIYAFLKKSFPNIRFIVTTHSADVISNNEGQEIIVIKNNNFEILDGKDYETNTDVRRIFNNLYFNNKESESSNTDVESILRKLYSIKIMKKWTSENDIELSNIKEELLNNAQKIILKRIREW